jgi:hypothetical protein
MFFDEVRKEVSLHLKLYLNATSCTSVRIMTTDIKDATKQDENDKDVICGQFMCHDLFQKT